MSYEKPAPDHKEVVIPQACIPDIHEVLKRFESLIKKAEVQLPITEDER